MLSGGESEQLRLYLINTPLAHFPAEGRARIDPGSCAFAFPFHPSAVVLHPTLTGMRVYPCESFPLVTGVVRHIKGAGKKNSGRKVWSPLNLHSQADEHTCAHARKHMHTPTYAHARTEICPNIHPPTLPKGSCAPRACQYQDFRELRRTRAELEISEGAGR